MSIHYYRIDEDDDPGCVWCDHPVSTHDETGCLCDVDDTDDGRCDCTRVFLVGMQR